mgnify:CR=1 FL=1
MSHFDELDLGPADLGQIDEGPLDAGYIDVGPIDLDELTRVAGEIVEEEASALEPFELPAPKPSTLRSEISGVSDEQWTEFAKAMRVQDAGAVSASNELGFFAMKPRRLADLGLMRELTRVQSPARRMVWVGEFVEPLTQEIFLRSPKLQYRAFADSMQRYAAGIGTGAVPRSALSALGDTTLSGVLAVLHRSGPSGLKNWHDKSKRFPNTVTLFEKVNGIF